ncbi:hypothetical protein M0802_009261 [Mischocyttarus mexicanus]|nr:hypothetical protein M0802_009261 [Mischocyttarus mexicanus]
MVRTNLCMLAYLGDWGGGGILHDYPFSGSLESVIVFKTEYLLVVLNISGLRGPLLLSSSTLGLFFLVGAVSCLGEVTICHDVNTTYVGIFWSRVCERPNAFNLSDLKIVHI